MGLLLGSIDEEYGIVHVRRCLILTRRDKKKDRVEIAYEDLSIASTIAEHVTSMSGHECKIIGWYHSHPHITVQPSTVDIQTQGLYQSIDQGFIGLIFSVYDKGNLDICAFQSFNSNGNMCYERLEIPVYITGSGMNTYESLLSLQISILSEEKALYENTVKANGSINTLATYNASIQHIVNTQLIPLKLAINCKKSSLQAQKESLLREIHMIATRVTDSADGVPVENNIKTTLHVNVVLAAMTEAFPLWVSIYDTLKVAFGGFSITKSVVLKDDVVVGLGGPQMLKIVPAAAFDVVTPWYIPIDEINYCIQLCYAVSTTQMNMKVLRAFGDPIELELYFDDTQSNDVRALANLNAALRLT
jgi:proteasome lid subunit RPN8/RPN11